MRERFTQDMKEALRSGDKRRLATIRLVQAALKDKDIELRGAGKGPASDDEVLGLLQKMIKQRLESVDLYRKGGREELAANEEAEIAVIERFLPQQMSEDEAKAAIQAIVAETGASSMKDMGRVMSAVQEEVAGRAEGGRVAAEVRRQLG